MNHKVTAFNSEKIIVNENSKYCDKQNNPQKVQIPKNSDNNEIRVIFPGGSVMKEDIYHTHPYNITPRYTHTHTHTHKQESKHGLQRESKQTHTEHSYK